MAREMPLLEIEVFQTVGEDAFSLGRREIFAKFTRRCNL
jgi:hypothetical protein